MTDRYDELMDRVVVALDHLAAGRPTTARRTLLKATDDPAERCGMATALGTAIAQTLAPDAAVIRTNLVVDPGAAPTPAQLDQTGLAAAVIAAAGNADMEGAAHAWIAAGPLTQTGALWQLLVIAASCTEERTA